MDRDYSLRSKPIQINNRDTQNKRTEEKSKPKPTVKTDGKADALATDKKTGITHANAGRAALQGQMVDSTGTNKTDNTTQIVLKRMPKEEWDALVEKELADKKKSGAELSDRDQKLMKELPKEAQDRVNNTKKAEKEVFFSQESIDKFTPKRITVLSDEAMEKFMNNDSRLADSVVDSLKSKNDKKLTDNMLQMLMKDTWDDLNETEALLNKAAKGDEDAFEQLVQKKYIAKHGINGNVLKWTVEQEAEAKESIRFEVKVEVEMHKIKLESETTDKLELFGSLKSGDNVMGVGKQHLDIVDANRIHNSGVLNFAENSFDKVTVFEGHAKGRARRNFEYELSANSYKGKIVQSAKEYLLAGADLETIKVKLGGESETHSSKFTKDVGPLMRSEIMNELESFLNQIKDPELNLHEFLIKQGVDPIILENNNK